MKAEAQAALDRLMASGEVELSPKDYAAVVAMLGLKPAVLPPGYNDPMPLHGLTRAERSANNRLAHRIISERRDEDAREAREARRAAKSRPGTQPGSPTAGQREGKE